MTAYETVPAYIRRTEPAAALATALAHYTAELAKLTTTTNGA